MDRVSVDGPTSQARRWGAAAGWAGIGGLVAGLVAAHLECLFLFSHVGAFSLGPELVWRAVTIDTLAGGATGAVAGLLAYRLHFLARQPRETVSVGFATVLAAFGAAFLVSFLRGMAFPPHRLSPRAPAAVTISLALSLLAFVVLSRLCGRLVRSAWTYHDRGSRWPLAVATAAVSLGLVATTLFLTIRGWRGEARQGVGTGRRPDVLLVVLDAARPDFFSCCGNSQGLTPHLDQLASEGQVFLRAYSSSNWSIPGHASLFSGLYPTAHGAFEVESRLDERVPTLAATLARAGWAAASFYENPLLGRQAGLARGFSAAVGPELDHRAGLTVDWWLDRLTHRGSRTAQCLRLADDWIESAAARKLPYFVFLNLMPTHFPYEARQPYFNDIARDSGVRPADCRTFGDLRGWEINQQSVWRRLERATPGELACLRALYASNLAHLDDALGKFLGKLRSVGRLDNTIVVVTADHGENLGEHGLFTHMRNALFEPSTRVPLIVWAPGKLAPARVASPVSLVDVMPTILGLAGLEKEIPSGVQGVDLRRTPFDRMVLTEYWDDDRRAFSRAGVVAERKIVASSDGTVALYDLASDPGEVRNLATSEPDEAARLQASLVRLVAGLRPLAPTGSEPRDLDELRDRLRSLGYIQ